MRLALNRFSDGNNRGRPLTGVDVSAVIHDWAMDTDASKRAAGEEVGLHRDPCPEAAVWRVFEIGMRARGSQLGWCTLIIVMMLGFLRGASCAGFQSGNVCFDRYGALVLTVRYVKRRSEFRSTRASLG